MCIRCDVALDNSLNIIISTVFKVIVHYNESQPFIILKFLLHLYAFMYIWNTSNINVYLRFICTYKCLKEIQHQFIVKVYMQNLNVKKKHKFKHEFYLLI